MPAKVLSLSLPDFTGLRLDERLQLLKLIGSGTYGAVYCAMDLHSHPSAPHYYAVKCQSRKVDARQLLYQRREVALHQLASAHEGVVHLRKVVQRAEYSFLVLDFCPDGDLFTMLTKTTIFVGNDALIRETFMQLLDAVDYMHSLGIYHRDLKPENILCADGGRRVLITDFGLATGDKVSGDFECGSSFYMSPECLGEVFGRFGTFAHAPSDVWALGVILVNLTCARNPWRLASMKDEAFRAYLHDPNYLSRVLPISPEMNDILKRVFTLNPAARISVSGLRAAVKRVSKFSVPKYHLNPEPSLVAAYKHPRRKPAPVFSIFSGELPDSTLDIADEQLSESMRGEPTDSLHVAHDTYGRHEEAFQHQRASSSASSVSSAGPATPEMLAFDDAHVVAAGLDDDVLDIRAGWASVQLPPPGLPQQIITKSSPATGATSTPKKKALLVARTLFESACKKIKVFAS